MRRHSRAGRWRTRRRLGMLVREVMKRDVATIGPDASLAQAARVARDRDVGCLPVVEDDRLIGMITDRDIVVRGVAERLYPDRSTVRDAMSIRAFACSAETTTEEAQKLMALNLIKHLPVIDSDGRVVGLVSLRDITGQFGRCRPHQVTFFRRLMTSSGGPRDVEVARLYVSPMVGSDELVPAALARFAEGRGVARWDQAADDYRVDEAG